MKMRILHLIRIITKLYFILILLLVIQSFNSCTTQKKLSHINKREISKVIYDNYFEFPPNAKISLEEYQDTLLTNFIKKYNYTLSGDEKKC